MSDLENKPIIRGPMKFLVASSMTDGLKALLRQRVDGRFRIVDIWSPEDILLTPAKAHVKLYCFPAEGGKPFALICPGGAYASVALLSEGFPVAAALNDQGYPAFVLVYRTAINALYPAPMDDQAQAIRYIMANAAQLGVSMDNYSLWGFSAGGHLAASFGTDNMGAAHYGLPKPAVLVTSYPVVSMGEKAHRLSRRLLLGRNMTPQDIEMASIEKQITPSFPPTYIWHCTRDPVVDASNSDDLADALQLSGVPRVYKKVDADVHGWGLGRGTPADGWFEEALAFWQEHSAELPNANEVLKREPASDSTN